MTRYRRQLAQLRRERVLDRQVGAPLPRIRPGQELDALPGQIFEVIVDNDALPGVIVAGRVTANGEGRLRVDPVLRAVDGRLTTAPLDGPPVALDVALARVAGDRGRGSVPGHPGCERLP